MISNNEITFVITGYVPHNDDADTHTCVRSIRDLFPGSQIILSTDKGPNLDGYDVDVVVQSDDPGGIHEHDEVVAKEDFSNPKFKKQAIYSTNRQIVSISQGLKHVKTKYSCRIRTDFQFVNNNMLEYIDRYDQYDEKYHYLNQRILITSYNTHRFESEQDTNRQVFFIGDFVFCGLTQDMITLFDIPLIDQYDLTDFHIDGRKDKYNRTCRTHYPTEQYFGMNLLKKQGLDVDLVHCKYVSPELINLHNRYLANNFVVLNFGQYGIYGNKHFLMANNTS